MFALARCGSRPGLCFYWPLLGLLSLLSPTPPRMQRLAPTSNLLGRRCSLPPLRASLRDFCEGTEVLARPVPFRPAGLSRPAASLQPRMLPRSIEDCKVLLFGRLSCPPGHRAGPRVRRPSAQDLHDRAEAGFAGCSTSPGSPIPPPGTISGPRGCAELLAVPTCPGALVTSGGAALRAAGK